VQLLSNVALTFLINEMAIGPERQETSNAALRVFMLPLDRQVSQAHNSKTNEGMAA